MILHDIDGISTWIEPMKKNTEREMILSRRRGLELMKAQGIVPNHYIIDNEISMAYRMEIKKTCMTYQLVTPDYHQHSLA